jgi:hypothetical protein
VRQGWIQAFFLVVVVVLLVKKRSYSCIDIGRLIGSTIIVNLMVML